MAGSVTVEEIMAFERDIAERFNRGEIRSPVHLDGGNEHQLIEIFKRIERNAWICGSWRMHAKCLLHGVPPDRLRADIIAGNSIALCYPEYRIVSSAIVGGILPIAMGIAWWIRRTGGSEVVYVFLGDMTALTGAAIECRRYAEWNLLPIVWVIEDNGMSVSTDTLKAWGVFDRTDLMNDMQQYGASEYYRYQPTYPHAGAGKRINF